MEKPLDMGTVVYRKREGILKKLEPRFEGPFKIVKRTSKNNYILSDQTGVELPTTVPLHKLKLTTLDDNFDDTESIQ